MFQVMEHTKGGQCPASSSQERQSLMCMEGFAKQIRKQHPTTSDLILLTALTGEQREYHYSIRDEAIQHSFVSYSFSLRV